VLSLYSPGVMPRKVEVDLNHDQEIQEGLIEDFVILLKHISECEKCRRAWEEIKRCAGM
jgi:hypothetical protein